MKADELINKLNNNPFHEKYNGVYTRADGSLVAFTTAKTDQEGNLVFFFQNKKEPLTYKRIATILSLHKEKTLYYYLNGNKQEILGYQIDHGKIIF